MMAEYIERWPYAMGEKHANRWLVHLTQLESGAALKAFDHLIMKREKPFAFDALEQLAISYKRSTTLDDVRQWKKEAKINQQNN